MGRTVRFSRRKCDNKNVKKTSRKFFAAVPSIRVEATTTEEVVINCATPPGPEKQTRLKQSLVHLRTKRTKYADLGKLSISITAAATDTLAGLGRPNTTEEVNAAIQLVAQDIKDKSTQANMTAFDAHNLLRVLASSERSQKLKQSYLPLTNEKNKAESVKVLSVLCIDFTLEELNTYVFPHNKVFLKFQCFPIKVVQY